jgi:integrase
MKHRAGSGSVYKRGNTWTIGYYVRGKRIRESVPDARNEQDARGKLRQRIAEIHSHRFIGPAEDKLLFSDLVQLIKNDYTIKERASLVNLRYHFKHLEPFFRWRRAIDITAPLVQEYQLKRLGEGAQASTINREVSTLQRSLNIAVRLNKLNRAPIFEKLKEDNVRQGFLNWNDFDKILAEVREQWRRNTIEFSFLVGWRFGRVSNLEWKHVFLNDDPPVIRTVNDVNTKKAPAPLPLNGRLLEIIQEQQAARELSCPYVFHHNGRKIGNFRKAWHSACGRAGFGKIVPHDFRRSLAKNLSQAGVPIPTIMQRAGWRTMSTFLRYRITDLKDQADANAVIDQARGTAVSKVEKLGELRGIEAASKV